MPKTRLAINKNYKIKIRAVEPVQHLFYAELREFLKKNNAFLKYSVDVEIAREDPEYLFFNTK